MAQGGTFKSGFASGFSSSFFSPGTSLGGDGAGGFTLRTTISGVVGGTASEIGGGKFANGAISGAFVHMFNAENLVKDWLTGDGAKMRVYGPKNKMTKELSTDPAVRYHKSEFLKNGNILGRAKYYPTKFGLTDFFFGNSNTLQNIGSYGLSIYGTGENELTFVISNDMGFSSLTAGLFSNFDSGSMATIETWFWWKESIK